MSGANGICRDGGDGAGDSDEVIRAYDVHVQNQQRLAREAERDFLDGLTDVERRRLEMSEIVRGGGDVGLSRDIAESPCASYEPNMAEEVDSLADELMEEFRFLDRRSDAVRLAGFMESRLEAEQERYNAWLLSKVIMRLTEAGNSKMVSVSLAFAAGVPEVIVNGKWCKTQIEAARALVVSRQNLSKEVRKSADWLGIKEGIHLKSPAAVEAFRAAQKGNHWRRRSYGNKKPE